MITVDTKEFTKSSKALQKQLRKFQSEIETKVAPILIQSGAIIQTQAQRNAPVLTGTLRRSIHTSNKMENAQHKDDFEKAKQLEIPNTKVTIRKKGIFHKIIVGTWLNYAARREREPVTAGTYMHEGKLITKIPGRDHYMYRAFEAKWELTVRYFYTHLKRLVTEIGARA